MYRLIIYLNCFRNVYLIKRILVTAIIRYILYQGQKVIALIACNSTVFPFQSLWKPGALQHLFHYNNFPILLDCYDIGVWLYLDAKHTLFRAVWYCSVWTEDYTIAPCEIQFYNFHYSLHNRGPVWERLARVMCSRYRLLYVMWLVLISPQAVSMYSPSQHTWIMTNFYSYIVEPCHTRSDQLLCLVIVPQVILRSKLNGSVVIQYEHLHLYKVSGSHGDVYQDGCPAMLHRVVRQKFTDVSEVLRSPSPGWWLIATPHKTLNFSIFEKRSSTVNTLSTKMQTVSASFYKQLSNQRTNNKILMIYTNYIHS